MSKPVPMVDRNEVVRILAEVSAEMLRNGTQRHYHAMWSVAATEFANDAIRRIADLPVEPR